MDMSGAMTLVMVVMMGVMLAGMGGVAWAGLRRRFRRRSAEQHHDEN